MEPQARFTLNRKVRSECESLLADGNTPQKIAKRARIVLTAAAGHGVIGILREAGVFKPTVWRWQDYGVEAGVEGLGKGRSNPPGRKPISAAIKRKAVAKTVKERPANATHGSVRAMAEATGIRCKILDLRFQALPDEITACHSSIGGHPRARPGGGEGIDVVKDASTGQSPWITRAGAAGAIARCLQRAFFRTPYGILDTIEFTSPIMPAVA